ncbi:MAG TPA: DinB family protein [Micromonosporaceae bacterium]|nr:DinB family protein [Micromonosporaceae bacterium]
MGETLIAGDLRLTPIDAPAARAILDGDLTDLTTGAGWPDPTDEVLAMVAEGAIEGWLVVLDGAVVGDAGAMVDGETGVYIYALTEPHQTRSFDVAAAIAEHLASRPGISSVYDTTPSPTDRRPPRVLTGEQDTLLAFLDYLRESLIGKLEGVSEADARRTFVRSGTNLIGLVMHVAQTEHVWVVNRWAGDATEPPHEFPRPGDTVESVAATARATGERVNALMRAEGSLDVLSADPAMTDVPLRWILVHLIEEVGRHAGHADIVRELIDGHTGR